jgi:thiol-disulfide isomerase/thioredoxin
MIKIVKIALLIILAAAVELSLTLVRADMGFSYSMLIGYTVYFFIAYISMRFTKNLTAPILILSLFLGISAMHLPPRLIDFEGTLVSLPDYIFHVLGLISAWLFYLARSWRKWIIAGVGFALTLFMFFRGYSMWIHKLNFETYTGNYITPLPEFVAEYKNGNRILRDSLKSKLVLIDIWHTQCAACFRKFPTLEKIYLKHQHNSKVKFLALNIPLPTDQPTRAYDMIHKRGYSFPVAKLQTLSILDTLSISFFPTTILVNEDGLVIFKGSIENGITLLEREIKKQAP